MRILAAVDGSCWSEAVVEELTSRPWPARSQVLVFSVAHPYPLLPDPFFIQAAHHYESLDEEQARALRDTESAALRIRAARPGLEVDTATAIGSPQKLILAEAEEWGADLILVGSHGRGLATRFLLGSVSTAVVLHAHCSVEVVRSGDRHDAKPAGAKPPKHTSRRPSAKPKAKPRKPAGSKKTSA